MWEFSRRPNGASVKFEDDSSVETYDLGCSRIHSFLRLSDIATLIVYFNEMMTPGYTSALYPTSESGPGILANGLSSTTSGTYLRSSHPELFWSSSTHGTIPVAANLGSLATPEEVCARLCHMEMYMPKTRWVVHQAAMDMSSWDGVIVGDSGDYTFSGTAKVGFANPDFTDSVCPVYHGSISGKRGNDRVGGSFCIVPAGRSLAPDAPGYVYLDPNGDVLSRAKSLYGVIDETYCSISNIELIHTLNDRYALYE